MRLSPRTEDRLAFALVVIISIIFITIIALPARAAVDPFGVEANSDLLAIANTSYEPGDWSFLVAEYWQGADFDRAMSIMRCESGGDPNAVSPTNDHGLFQHNARYAPPRFEAVGYTWADRYDPEANTAAAHWLWEREGWTPWSCNRLVGVTDWFEPVTVDLTDYIEGTPAR